MNSPKQLFYLTVPLHLHRNGMPDMQVIVESVVKNNNVTNIRFLDRDNMELIKVTDWDELYLIACDRAQDLWDGNNVTVIGEIENLKMN